MTAERCCEDTLPLRDRKRTLVGFFFSISTQEVKIKKLMT